MVSLSHLDADSIPAQFAQLVANPGDHNAAALTCITVVGAYLGRKSALTYRDEAIYPMLYSIILGQPSTLADWHKWFLKVPGAPPVTKSGISKAESLVYLVRDRVIRPDKVYTGKGKNPEWRMTNVDPGVTEKRHLIMQRLGPLLTCKQRAAASRLLEVLGAAYEDGNLSVYVTYRDGGFHRAKNAHIALLMPEAEDRIAAAISERLPVLLASGEGPARYPENNSNIWDVLSDINLAIKYPPPVVTVAPEGAVIIESAAASKRPYAVRTLLRVAHILTVLEQSSVVNERLLRQAHGIIEASESTRRRIGEKSRAFLRDEIVEFVRTARSGVRSRHEITRRFRRRSDAGDLCSALAELGLAQQLIPTTAKTNGRDREEWRVP